MNSAPLNGIVLNGGPLDAIQRSATFVEAVAQVTMSPRVWARSLIDTAINVAADVVVGSRVNVRSVTNLIAAAEFTLAIKNFTTAPTQWTAQASTLFDGTAQDRTEVRDPLVLNVGVLPTINARVLMRSPETITSQATIVARESSYTLARSPITIGAQADIWLQIDVLRRIPYDEDTVPERTITLNEDLRVVYVS